MSHSTASLRIDDGVSRSLAQLTRLNKGLAAPRVYRGGA
jgi:hypothetical protein